MHRIFLTTKGGKLHTFLMKTWPACCTKLLYMVVFFKLSATISGWTPFATSYCNCKIQDGVQDGRHGLASTLKKHSYTLFPITQSNVNRFSKFFHCQISTNTFYEFLKNCPFHLKCVATLPCETWMLSVTAAVHVLLFSIFYYEKRSSLLQVFVHG